jgi:hypothetical protein
MRGTDRARPWGPPAQTYAVRFELLHRHNEPHKPQGMQRLIEAAVEAQAPALEAELGRRELRFVFGTEDFPIVGRDRRLRLPSFQMCVTPDSADVPIPGGCQVGGQLRAGGRLAGAGRGTGA